MYKKKDELEYTEAISFHKWEEHPALMLQVEVFDWSLLASSNLYFNMVNTTFPQSFNCFVKFMYEYLNPFHGFVEYNNKYYI